VYNKINKF